MKNEGQKKLTDRIVLYAPQNKIGRYLFFSCLSKRDTTLQDFPLSRFPYSSLLSIRIHHNKVVVFLLYATLVFPKVFLDTD